MSKHYISLEGTGISAEKLVAKYSGRYVATDFDEVKVEIGIDADGFFAWNRTSESWVRGLITRRAAAKTPAPVARTSGAITASQASYLASLLRRSDAQSVYGTLYTIDGSVDTAAIARLTKQAASAVISQLV